MMHLYFVTHETRPYETPSTLERITVEARPTSIAELEELIKGSSLAKHVQHGYRLEVHDFPSWGDDYTTLRVRELTDRDMQKNRIDEIYIICRRPRQHRQGFKFLLT